MVYGVADFIHELQLGTWSVVSGVITVVATSCSTRSSAPTRSSPAWRTSSGRRCPTRRTSSCCATPRPSSRSSRARARLLRRLLRDHQVLDLGVGRRRHDLLADQLVLLRVRAARDDLLRVRVADAGQRLQLILGRAVEVDELWPSPSALAAALPAALPVDFCANATGVNIPTTRASDQAGASWSWREQYHRRPGRTPGGRRADTRCPRESVRSVSARSPRSRSTAAPVRDADRAREVGVRDPRVVDEALEPRSVADRELERCMTDGLQRAAADRAERARCVAAHVARCRRGTAAPTSAHRA